MADTPDLGSGAAGIRVQVPSLVMKLREIQGLEPPSVAFPDWPPELTLEDSYKFLKR